MKGGVLFEHGHRMVAFTVSCLMVGLAITTQVVEQRVWVKKLAWSALGAVVLQAVLGGVTVLLHLPTQVSVAHAGLAQIFFCLVVTLALVTSRSWIEENPHRLTDRPSPIRLWAAWTTALVYLQIVLGAVTRHSGAGLAIPDFPLSFGQLLPPDWSPLVALQFSHTRIGALIVLLFVSHTAYRACFHFPEEKGLFWPAAAAGLLVWFQCFLGMAILFTQKAIVPTSVHVIVGAATLASMLVLTLNSFQLFKKGTAS
jgi:cytochrome c oxidase assembly protein subunit 15